MNILQLFFSIVTLALLIVVAIKFYLKYTTAFYKSKRRLDGKVAIVTGANTGIGFETAKDLARRGAKVILACRDLNKAEIAAEQIMRENRNHNVVTKKLDLSSMKQIRSFCKEILKEETRLDILINNAGIALINKVMTEDGFEGHMATNHLGPFLLTNLLLGVMMKSGDPSRIVNVSSRFHKYIKTLEVDNLNSEKHWEPRSIYGKTKLCNVLFTVELHRRLQNAGLGNQVTVNALHPGVIKTGVFSHVKKITMYKYLLAFLEIFFMTTWEGAQTSLQLAVSEEMDGISGLYWANCKNALMNKLAEDKELGYNLWKVSADLVKLKPSEYHLPL